MNLPLIQSGTWAETDKFSPNCNLLTKPENCCNLSIADEYFDYRAVSWLHSIFVGDRNHCLPNSFKYSDISSFCRNIGDENVFDWVFQSSEHGRA